MSEDSARWANKYRPRTFDEVVGQDAAVAILKGAFKRGTLGSSILITGPSGNGKTTLARIIAAKLSGYKGDDLEKNKDLMENNTGADRSIEFIRQCIEASKYSPVGGKRRIMMFDEVHALLGPAVSALLKELEEPPKKTTWILCTDQPHKLPNTVLGRCQIVKLQAVTPDAVKPLLQRVLKAEKVKFGDKTERVIDAVANATYGQPRLSLQVLEDVVNSVAGGGKLKDAIQNAVHGRSDVQAFHSAQRFLMAVLNGESSKAAEAVAATDSPDGLLIMANQMLESMIRRALGHQPNSGIGWATKGLKVSGSQLPELLNLQARLVAALDVHGRYVVPPASLLYGLARPTK